MSRAMERALLVSNSAQLKQFNNSFTRIYFGSEFCERLLPNKSDLVKAKRFCEKNSCKFSLVTPYLTDWSLAKAVKLAKMLSDSDELVVNDYGLLLAAKKTSARLVAGRLLNRQFRDPRIAAFGGSVPPDFSQHLRQSHAGSRGFQNLLLQNGVERVELDNLLQGIGTNLGRGKLLGSVYHPFGFVSTARVCLSANCGKISFHDRIGIFPCEKECMRYQFNLRNNLFPDGLFLFGNTVMYKNSRLPGERELLKRGIDRIVTDKALQLQG